MNYTILSINVLYTLQRCVRFRARTGWSPWNRQFRRTSPATIQVSKQCQPNIKVAPSVVIGSNLTLPCELTVTDAATPNEIVFFRHFKVWWSAISCMVLCKTVQCNTLHCISAWSEPQKITAERLISFIGTLLFFATRTESIALYGTTSAWPV